MTIKLPKFSGEDRSSLLAELDQRSRNIFRRLVETYIETGEPVGSRTISRILPANLSPASVRNVMMDLEDSGLIYAPHTSAGRVPTEIGLRFFVDALLEVGNLSAEERSHIDAEIAASNRPRRVEDVLGEATTLLSGLSHCAGVVMSPKSNTRLKQIEFVNLAPGRALVILVNQDGSVENRVIDVPPDLSPAIFTRASNYLSARLHGKGLQQVKADMEMELSHLRRELDEVSARVVETGLAIWSGETDASSRNLIVKARPISSKMLAPWMSWSAFAACLRISKTRRAHAALGSGGGRRGGSHFHWLGEQTVFHVGLLSHCRPLSQQ